MFHLNQVCTIEKKVIFNYIYLFIIVCNNSSPNPFDHLVEEKNRTHAVANLLTKSVLIALIE